MNWTRLDSWQSFPRTLDGIRTEEPPAAPAPPAPEPVRQAAEPLAAPLQGTPRESLRGRTGR
jgi:hypothetical protein